MMVPPRPFVMMCALAALASGAIDASKLQQTLGSATVAANAKNYDLAQSKLDLLVEQIGQWRAVLAEKKKEAEAPAVPEAAPEPPAESVPFSINSTHIPAKCPRKSVEGAVMKVHYVGRLIKNNKIFASSFHTGSMPLRFVLGTDDVVAAWNQGLLDMCEGERRRLMVPWDLGYGEKGGKGVPPYSDLQYDFELVELSLPKIPKGKKAKSEL